MTGLYDDALATGPGGPLSPRAGQAILNDADAATVFEQLRWLRAATLVTPTGGLAPRHRPASTTPHTPDKETTP